MTRGKLTIKQPLSENEVAFAFGNGRRRHGGGRVIIIPKPANTLSIGLYEDDGYRYGSRWLYRPIPEKDLEEIKSFISG